MWINVLQMFHNLDILFLEVIQMEKNNKTYSMSIRVTYEELEKLKKAAILESYSSYSEFVRRTALLEAEKVLNSKKSVNK